MTAKIAWAFGTIAAVGITGYAIVASNDLIRALMVAIGGIAIVFCGLGVWTHFHSSSITRVVQSTIKSSVGTAFENKSEPSLQTAIGQIVAESIQRVLIETGELAREHGKLGLAEVYTECMDVDYGALISDSAQLTIVLNDGRTWISTHRERLRKRLADANKETTVFLVHPNSPFIEVLARKGSKDAHAISARIMETVEVLEEICGLETRLTILGHYLFNPQAVVVGDSQAVTTPFFFSRGGRNIPAFKFKDSGEGCYFRALIEDLNRLRMDSELLCSDRLKLGSLPSLKLRDGSEHPQSGERD